MKTLRKDMASLAAALVLPCAALLCVPFGAIGFKAADASRRETFLASFVSLSRAEEAAAMHVAKSSWQKEGAGSAGARLDLSAEELPEPPSVPAMDAPRKSSDHGRMTVRFGLPPLPPSAGARPPETIPGAPAIVPPPAFSREEMISIDKVQ